MMFARLFWMLGIVLWATPALADATVVVLGLRSVEGDDDVANELTEHLRVAARGVEGWTVSNAAVSMAQMSLAHGCEEIDAACLSEIASGLQADVVIYGTLRRNSARTDYDFALGLSMFDGRAGQIAKSVDDIVPRAESAEDMAARAQKLIGRLSSTSSGGTISIQANAADADVRVNGQQVGSTREGALRLEGLQPGQYRIEILKDGYTPHVSTVTVVEGGETSIAAVLASTTAPPDAAPVDYGEPASGGHRLAWLGWTLIGVGAVSLIGMGISMAVIQEIDDDPLKRQYSDAVARGNMRAAQTQPQDVVNDVCVAAKRGNPYELGADAAHDVADKCATADTMEVLQWVFLGTAVAAGGTGLVLVLTADDGPDERAAREPALSLRPHVARDGAGLSAALRF
jgi:hypothetical protein